MRVNSARTGGVLGSLLLIVSIIFVLGVVGGLSFAWRIANGDIRVLESENRQGKLVELTTPVGSLRVQEHERLNPKHIGVPVYPGARLHEHENKGASIELDLGGEHRELKVVVAVYTTTDSVDEVTDFYRKHLPHWIFSRRGMEYTEGGYKRFIAVKRRAGTTRITLASTGEPAAN